jgi:hypothetical protein
MLVDIGPRNGPFLHNSKRFLKAGFYRHLNDKKSRRKKAMGADARKSGLDVANYCRVGQDKAESLR